ncbi:MAG TPA: hypothetical protein VK116_09985, partial [Planctomycetota bacterium]|nr:hypothetical protein [Planctomycetota bacterium]
MSRPASSPSSPPSSDGPSSTARRTRVRWWILVAIWGLVGIAIGTLWAVDAPRQTIVIATIASVFGGVMLSLLWLLVVSGLSIRA